MIKYDNTLEFSMNQSKQENSFRQSESISVHLQFCGIRRIISLIKSYVFSTSSSFSL